MLPAARSTLWLSVALTLTALAAPAGAAPNDAAAFRDHAGVPLVFDPNALPDGLGFDRMPALTPARQAAAAALLAEEVGKYPRGYLRAVGLQRVAVFAACIDDEGDGFRAYDAEHQGYLYFGLYTAGHTVIACYYNDSQLPLTFHHEVFHAVDHSHRKRHGDTAAAWRDAVAMRAPYPALALDARTRKALAEVASGRVLEGAVSDYAAKNPGEDRAETARWVMRYLPDALLQAATRPELPGTQRILGVLARWRDAVADGPDPAFLAARALGEEVASETIEKTPNTSVRTLSAFVASELDDATIQRARAEIDALAASDLGRLAPAQRTALVRDASTVLPRLMRARLRVDTRETRFTVWRPADGVMEGGNPVLRADIGHFADDAERAGRLQRALGSADATLTEAQLSLLRLLARYRAFIAANWPISATTAAAFDDARGRIARSLPVAAGNLRNRALQASWDDLATASIGSVPAAPARPTVPATPTTPARRPDNAYLAKVDAAVADPAVRAAIRAVQPATVRIGGGSGVNLAARGLILTNAHVAKAVGRTYTVTFPDGARFTGRTTAIDNHLDLALVTLEGARDLPIARIAAAAPTVGTPVVVIGQPGTTTPDGQPTGYQPFHVSTGRIRSLRADPLGPQSLGAVGHDAWTYWGHSGSPLFDHRGYIIALHNSWDSSTAMRHAVPWEALLDFVERGRTP